MKSSDIEIRRLCLVFLASSVFFVGPQYGQKFKLLNHSSLQYAGGIGMFSVGVGHAFFSKKSGELDAILGWAPKKDGGSDIWSVSGKYTHLIRAVEFESTGWKLNPVGVGIFVNQPYGDNYTKYSDRSRYPKGYYWFNNLPRMGWFWSGRLTKELKNERSISFYSEVGTYDLYVFSWFGNQQNITFKSLFNMSIGLKYHFKQ